MSNLSYFEAAVIGLLQGVSELFPVSSLGHSVLLPALIGGGWARDLDMSAPNSPYLSVLVAMHVATALALVIFFWRDWVRIIGGLLTSVRDRRIETPYQRLGWLLVVGTIPVGIAGLALEKVVREYLGKPVPASIFLALNGLVLYAVEKYRQRRGENEDIPHAETLDTIPLHQQETIVMSAVSTEQTVPIPAVRGHDVPTGDDRYESDTNDPGFRSDVRLSRQSWLQALLIGAAQSLALLPGISRSGITMVGGLARGLRHEDAARFAFLLSTPAIGGAGLLKIPELFAPEAQGALGPALLGSVLAGFGAYISVRFLTSYFETRTLRPFALYCIIAGLACVGWFAL
ncbi:undecaprenyl-diphosphate phosphatase [Saccharopolyspora phatthalungensis]|uniref:Undecaprenyl-diphosphatase n=1 Tax=Saccharopolyspora phatthalungensis TaxID=664693 RepID=A0A840QFL9_9PSEU|nr:undecaprenyl-diphosphate phosphatase [Saccharopolyspora phatthalungensis]MBB5159236.1 undecaprenyl-diphosphatase [Saccharopolyspora phatthalungensis]